MEQIVNLIIDAPGPTASSSDFASTINQDFLVEHRRDLGQDLYMDRERAVEILRSHESELKATGIVHLKIFGSVARNQASTLSDVDLLAEFDPARKLTLVTIGSLEGHLSDLLGARVELCTKEWMRDPVRAKALSEAVLAF